MFMTFSTNGGHFNLTHTILGLIFNGNYRITSDNQFTIKPFIFDLFLWYFLNHQVFPIYTFLSLKLLHNYQTFLWCLSSRYFNVIWRSILKSLIFGRFLWLFFLILMFLSNLFIFIIKLVAYQTVLSVPSSMSFQGYLKEKNIGSITIV